MELQRNVKPRKDNRVVYGGIVFISPDVIEGEVPQSIRLEGISLKPVARAMTAEERKNLTPQQKADAARVYAEKLQEKARKLEAVAATA